MVSWSLLPSYCSLVGLCVPSIFFLKSPLVILDSHYLCPPPRPSSRRLYHPPTCSLSSASPSIFVIQLPDRRRVMDGGISLSFIRSLTPDTPSFYSLRVASAKVPDPLTVFRSKSSASYCVSRLQRSSFPFSKEVTASSPSPSFRSLLGAIVPRVYLFLFPGFVSLV